MFNNTFWTFDAGLIKLLDMTPDSTIEAKASFSCTWSTLVVSDDRAVSSSIT